MIARLRVTVVGAVQGVGFRPFVYRLAQELGLAGWVANSPAGVRVEVEGERAALDTFVLALDARKPPRASIHGLEHVFLDPIGQRGFEIRTSTSVEPPTALVLPDIATCADCLREIRDPNDRRYRYPFTNCTHCGPRFTIVEALPYDRGATSMKRFVMCPSCRAEYDDPLDRRFHAQPNACPACGPRLALWRGDGGVLADGDEALRRAVEAIAAEQIVAVKGLGGFHLVALAHSSTAVRGLRERKRREAKPLAVMAPSLAAVERLCVVSALERRVLRSPEAPIVLLARRATDGLAPEVAPENPRLGIMLPYTPLHHLLLDALGAPVVATSGNRAEEPICTDEREALGRLGDLADLFLVHDRPIVRHADDSIVRVMAGRELVLRRARGYAPLPVRLAEPSPPVLGVGGQLKSTVALATGSNAFVSQHIGDLENRQAADTFAAVIGGLRALYGAELALVATELHPGYHATQVARRLGAPVLDVQHHHAHVLSCMAENELAGPVLGVAWDGTGFGPDGSVWGGEFLRTGAAGFERVAALRPFRLPGGEQAVREPRRAALGALFEVFGAEAFARHDLAPVASFGASERAVLRRMIERGVNAPWTSSAGRLFDAAAALAGVRQRSRFEGEAAMALEFAADALTRVPPYPFEIAAATESAPTRWSPRWRVDWGPMLRAMLDDLGGGTPIGLVAAAFHDTLAAIVVAVATLAGEERIVLTGGCFQNGRLTERVVDGLRAAGFRPYWHQRIPPNDGGIALGQVMAATLALRAARNQVPAETAAPAAAVAGGRG